ncbi:MAG TPA: M23 family metallopeptidase [Candidatus Acidoferrum sp.]|nr:M23 family metallopeptidase [Candidatus Acidoferrum sp.]
MSTRHVQVAKSGVRLFCSAECMEAALHGWPKTHASERVDERSDTVADVRKPRVSKSKLFAIGLGIACLSPCNHVGDMSAAAGHATMAASFPVMAEKPRFAGPPAPNDEELALEFMSEVSTDRWIHPLAGPNRRMPIRDSRVFGASRHGDRPGECRNGHCGVDIGGEMWGEPIMAVHDGVVDRVKRVDEGNGGMYVRIAHRDGKVFTQYFHLAAIPRDLKEGDKVKAGQVIGLLGDTGVKESNPHLHFTVSVKQSPSAREIYMDPEPLIALWPLKVPRATGGADAAWDPGVPLGAAGRPRLDKEGKPLARKADMKRKRRRSDVDAAAADAGEESGGGAAAEGSGDADTDTSSAAPVREPAATEVPERPAPARFPFAPRQSASPALPGSSP